MDEYLQIVDLRVRPEYAPLVADRLWKAWWQPKGVSLEAFSKRVDEALCEDVLPSTFVALSQNRFVGTVSLIPCDLEVCSDLSPWLAALWVEPPYRSQGVGKKLVGEIISFSKASGFAQLYLCAKPEITPYYTIQGWTIKLCDVGSDKLNVLVCAL